MRSNQQSATTNDVENIKKEAKLAETSSAVVINASAEDNSSDSDNEYPEIKRAIGKRCFSSAKERIQFLLDSAKKQANSNLALSVVIEAFLTKDKEVMSFVVSENEFIKLIKPKSVSLDRDISSAFKNMLESWKWEDIQWICKYYIAPFFLLRYETPIMDFRELISGQEITFYQKLEADLHVKLLEFPQEKRKSLRDILFPDLKSKAAIVTTGPTTHEGKIIAPEIKRECYFLEGMAEVVFYEMMKNMIHHYPYVKAFVEDFVPEKDPKKYHACFNHYRTLSLVDIAAQYGAADTLKRLLSEGIPYETDNSDCNRRWKERGEGIAKSAVYSKDVRTFSVLMDELQRTQSIESFSKWNWNELLYANRGFCKPYEMSLKIYHYMKLIMSKVAEDKADNIFLRDMEVGGDISIEEIRCAINILKNQSKNPKQFFNDCMTTALSCYGGTNDEDSKRRANVIKFLVKECNYAVRDHSNLIIKAILASAEMRHIIFEQGYCDFEKYMDSCRDRDRGYQYKPNNPNDHSLLEFLIDHGLIIDRVQLAKLEGDVLSKDTRYPDYAERMFDRIRAKPSYSAKQKPEVSSIGLFNNREINNGADEKQQNPAQNLRKIG